ncbi:MAG TPA: ABC transporter permease [Anaerolineae bacterium]|nr:ABC transporter permease [Anaerolineae bacterium]
MRARLRELWTYRELIRNLVMRDLKVRYKNSVLGVAWSWLNPLLMMLVLTVVFTVMAGQNNQPAYHVFVLIGILAWNFFSASVVGATGSIVNNAHLIKKVYFPRAVLPVSIVLSSLLNFVIALPVFFALAWLSGVPLSGRVELIAWLPVVLLVQLVFTVGIGLILSTVNVFYRDTQIIMEVVMLAWFFVTPIFYTIETVPETAHLLGATLDLRRLLFILNPMASIISSYRDVLYWGRFIGPDFFLRTAVTAVGVLVIGYAVFDRYARRFAEEV